MIQDNANLALAYGKLGREREAYSIMIETLAAHRRVVGEIHPSTAQLYQNLANHHQKLQDFEPAIEYATRAVAIGLMLEMDEHPQFRARLSLLIQLLRQTGKDAAANEIMSNGRRYFEEIFAALGAEHDQSELQRASRKETVIEEIENLCQNTEVNPKEFVDAIKFSYASPDRALWEVRNLLRRLDATNKQ